MACWCGNAALVPFHDEYAGCATCGTLVFTGVRPAQLDEVVDEDRDFYGRAYWFERQASVHGLPNLEERARRDLRDRCPTWLRTLLAYRVPPGRVLEIGAAHGGMVAMARWAGFDATGLEVSPHVSEWAARHFEVPMVNGPLRSQNFPPASFDAILLLDVLEHLEDPLDTLRRCADLLAPGGLLHIQTPEYIPTRTFQELSNAKSPFLGMLIPVEHLFLFSRAAVKKLLAAAGLPYCIFEKGLSPEHNMTLVASSSPPVRHRPAEIHAALLGSPSSRLVQAILDLEADYSVADQDRRSRQEIIERANEQIRVSEAGRARLGADLREVQVPIRDAGPGSNTAKGARVGRSAPAVSPDARRFPRHIVVDLTPLQPGGANGGARPVALSLIRAMAQSRPHTHFTWLTLDRTLLELRALASPNVSVLCSTAPDRGFRRWIDRGLRALGRSPIPGGDLLFCPFTAPFFAGQAPVISLIHDLQFRTYPGFFSPQDRAEREAHALGAARKSVRLVASSSFVRGEILQHLEVAPDQVKVIPHGTHRRFPMPDPAHIPFGLQPRSYFLYPANYWPHKNHKMLLVALARFRRAQVVLTGAPGTGAGEIASAIAAMGLQDHVLQAGFLPDDQFAALLGFAQALLFPSLYEGFGMPILEAMQLGVPVLCSNTTSLPEVAGDAALFFDPRKPDDITAVLHRFLDEPGLAGDLTNRGLRRAAEFGDAFAMADRYLALFDEAVSTSPERRDALAGVFDDHWTAPQFTVSFAPASTLRHLELRLSASSGLPHSAILLRWLNRSVEVPRGRCQTIDVELPSAGGAIDFSVSPVFRPPAPETRSLGCQLLSCRILGPSTVELHSAPEELG